MIIGVSMDSAYQKFIPKKVDFLELNLIGTYNLFDDNEEDYSYYKNLDYLSKLNNYFEPVEKVRKSTFVLYEHYLECGRKMIEIIEKDERQTAFKEWLLTIVLQYGKDLYIIEDLGTYMVYCGHNIVQHEIWVGEDVLPANEDGRLLFNAMLNMKHLYDYEIQHLCMSTEILESTFVGDSKRLDTWATYDITQEVEGFEVFLNSVKPLPDDSYYEGRYKRWLIFLSVIKQGGKFTYSV